MQNGAGTIPDLDTRTPAHGPATLAVLVGAGIAFVEAGDELVEPAIAFEADLELSHVEVLSIAELAQENAVHER